VGSVTLMGNAASGPAPEGIPEVEADNVRGNLSCSGNAAVTNDSRPNIVSGARSGQCTSV
jgi:hypothetical protein